MSAELRGAQSEKARKLGEALGILDGDGNPRPDALLDPAKSVNDALSSGASTSEPSSLGSIVAVLNDIADGVPSRDEGGARFTIDGTPVQLAVGAIDARGRGVDPAQAEGVCVGVALVPLKVLDDPKMSVTVDVEAWLLKVWPRKTGADQFEPGLGLELKLDLTDTDSAHPLETASLRLRIDGTSIEDAKALLDLTLTPRTINAEQNKPPFSVTPPPISLSWDLSQSQDVLSLVVAAALSLAQFLLTTITREQATEVAGKTARKLLVLLGLIDSNYGSTNTALRLTPLELARLSTDADGALQTWLSANFADPSKARAWVGTVTSLVTTVDKPPVTSPADGEWQSDMQLAAGIPFGLLARRVNLGGRTWLRLGVCARNAETAFSTNPTTGAGKSLKAAFEAEVIPFAIALDGVPELVVEERFSAGIKVSGATTSAPVLTLTTTPPYAVKSARFGLSLTPEAGFRLITEADVVVGGDTITVDALNHPELAVGAVAAAGIAEALNINMGPLAAVLGAAVGLQEPPNAASTYPTITLTALTANPGGAYAEWLATLQGSSAHMLSWLGALRTAIATATGWNNMAPVEGVGTEANPWVLPLCERSARVPVALHFVTRRGATADQAELRVALSVAPPPLTLTTPGATAGARFTAVRVVNRLSLGLLDANVSKNTNDPTVVRFAARARNAWTVVHPTTGQDFSVTVSGTTKVQARQLDAVVSWDHALGLDADVALNTVKVMRGTETWLSYAKLSAADLVANAGSAVADLTKFAGVGLALALWRWNPEAAGRVLVLPRLLGQWPAAQGPLSDAEVGKLFADPLQEFPRLFGRRLKEWTAPDRHPLLLLRDVLFGDTPDIGAGDTITVTGSGTWADPWAVPLRRASTTVPVPLELLTWLDPAPGSNATHVGFGLRYTRTDTLNSLSLVEVARLDVVRVALADNASERGLAAMPAASLSATLKSSDGWLLGGPTEAIRLAAITGSLTWQAGKKLDADLQLKDAAWEGIPAESLGWSDARTAPLLDALRSAPKAPLAAGGAAAALLVTLGALGLAELDETGRTWALLRDPMDGFLRKPGEFLSLRLKDPAADALDLRALKDAFARRGASGDVGPWSWDLGGVTLSVSLGGWISLAASTLDYEFDLTLRPLDGQLRGTASVHPRVYWSTSARLDVDFDTGPTARSTSAQDAARHLRVGLYGVDATGTGLLGDGLELYPPERALGTALLEVLGKVAGGLFVKLVVDGVLLPALASSEPDAARVLQILGVLDGDATRGYATSMGLVGALDDPFGWCLASDRLAALGELIKNRTFADGRLRFRVSDSWNETSFTPHERMRARSSDRIVKAWIETATPFGAGGFAFDLSAGVQAFIPRGGTAPRRIEPVASARAAFTLTAGATRRTVATVLQVEGSDCTVDVVYSSGAGVANVELRLFPWSGISGLLTSAAQPLIVAILEQLWKEMTTSRNATASKIGAVIMFTVAALDLKGPESTYDIAVDKWAAFVGAPATRLDGIAKDAGRGAAWAMCFAGLGMVMGLRSDASDGYGVIRLGDGFELVSGRYEVAAGKMRFGAWLRLSADGWPTGVPLRPTAWTADRSRVGFYLENGAVKPDVSLSMALGADLGARWVLDFILRARVAANGRLALSVGIEDGNAQDNALALEVTFVPELKVTTAAGASKVSEDLLRTLILPLGMGILCTPALHDNILVKKPDLDGDGTADLNLEFGSILVATGLLTVSTTAPRYRPQRIPAAWNLWDAVLAAIGTVLESLSSSEVKLGAYRAESGADKRYGIELNGALKLLDDPGLRLGFGKAQSRPPSFPEELTRGARMRFQVLHKYGSESWSFAPGLDIRGLNLFLTGPSDGALIDEPESVVLQGFALTLDLSYLDSNGARNARAYSFTNKNYGVLFHLGGLSFPGGAASSSNSLVSGLLPARAADNPGFSLTVGYRDEHERICFGDDPKDNVVWIDVQQEVGPLAMRRLGLGIEPKSGDSWVNGCLQLGSEALSAHDLSLYYDGTFSLWGLQVEPWGLRLTMPLGTTRGREFYNPANWELNLDGLGITYTSDVVTIAAGLYRKGDEFLGAGVLRAGDFALSALFAYKNDSFFGVASASLPIGGSPAFYIQRVAAGFGHNRAFKEPKNGADVANHLLVDVLEGRSDVALDLDEVRDEFGVENGSTWAAAGVKFTSFGLIDGTALVYVLFNDATTIGLMGTASLLLGTSSATILKLNLGLTAQIVVSGEDPRVTVRADILHDSHLVFPGFALHGSAFIGYWFKRGDFLLSVGGYHPDFIPRDYYPSDLSRVGFDLALGGVDLWGRMYFALTPREVMLGAELHARGEWGPLAAWLSVWFNALVGWDPFYYRISAGVTLGGSIDLGLFGTVEVEFGASIKVWGPPFGGRATIEILCVDVEVEFGEGSSAPPLLDASQFAKSHLQLEGERNSPTALRGVARVNVPRGRSRVRGSSPDNPAGTAEDPIRIDPSSCLEVHTRIPATEWKYGAATVATPPDVADDLDLAPCGLTSLTSTVTVSLSGAETPSPVRRVLARPFPRADWDTDRPADARSASESDPTLSLADRLQLEFREKLDGSGTNTEFANDVGDVRLPLDTRREIDPFARPAPVDTPLGPLVLNLYIPVARTATATPPAPPAPPPRAPRARPLPKLTPQAVATIRLPRRGGPTGPLAPAHRARVTRAEHSRPAVRKSLHANARALLGAAGITVPPDGCAVYDLRARDAAGRRFAVRATSASTGVRVVALDRGGRVLSDATLGSSTGAASADSLPAQAARMVFSTFPAPTAGSAVGFTANTPLIPVAGATWLAPGMTVRQHGLGSPATTDHRPQTAGAALAGLRRLGLRFPGATGTVALLFTVDPAAALRSVEDLAEIADVRGWELVRSANGARVALLVAVDKSAPWELVVSPKKALTGAVLSPATLASLRATLREDAPWTPVSEGAVTEGATLRLVEVS